MLSVPAHGFNVVGTRLLVVSRKQHFMLWIAVATAVLNAALDAAFYLWFGPIGIVVSTVVVRWVMAGVYLALLRVVMPRTIGQDLAEQLAGDATGADRSPHRPGASRCRITGGPSSFARRTFLRTLSAATRRVSSPRAAAGPTSWRSSTAKTHCRR